MKLPLTDKFLWDLYKFIESLDRALDMGIPTTMKEALSPDLLKFKREWDRKLTARRFAKLIYSLKRQGLIKIANLENKKGVILTPKGLERILKIKYKSLKKKLRKDGKFQMIIFDIPEKKRFLRDLLRTHLQFLGYKMLQKSIWITSYDVEKETEEFLRKYGLDPYVRLFLIEQI